MKNLLRSLTLGLILSLGFSFTPQENNLSNNESLGCHYSQCQATAKSTGNQCKHCVSDEGDLYCWQHR